LLIDDFGNQRRRRITDHGVQRPDRRTIPRRKAAINRFEGCR
jgi:hypothetical protein